MDQNGPLKRGWNRIISDVIDHRCSGDYDEIFPVAFDPGLDHELPNHLCVVGDVWRLVFEFRLSPVD